MRINAGRFLTRRAMLSPDKVGLSCEGRDWTFAELNQRSNRLAHAMARMGVRSGDRVGVLTRNGVEYYDLFFGLAKMGAILVPINIRLVGPEIAAIIEDSGLKVLVHDAAFDEKVEGAKISAAPFQAVTIGRGCGPGAGYDDILDNARESEPAIQAGDDDESVILYAGWSGGRPRGVMLTHENFFWASVTGIATLTRLGPVFLVALPLFHIGALGWLPMFMHLGTRCVLMPGFDADRFLELVESEGVTSFGAVPTMLHYLKDSERFRKCDFTKVRDILSYGSATPVELIDEYGKSDIRIRQLYGLTESAGPALVIDGEHALVKAGSCGLPFFHTRVRLVDDMGQEVAAGSIGEVVIQADHVMKGYWNQAEATEDALRGGWLFTGDLGRQDEDGYFYIVDRKKDMIITGGENVYPAEVETVLVEHPEVDDAAVIGVPDRIWGESVKAVIVRSPGSGMEAKELIEWLRGKIASFKTPKEITFIDSIPRSRTGKMEKSKLRKSLQE